MPGTEGTGARLLHVDCREIVEQPFIFEPLALSSHGRRWHAGNFADVVIALAWVADQGLDNGSLLFVNDTQYSLRVDSSGKLKISLVFVHSFATFRFKFNTKVAIVNNFIS